MAEQLKKIGEQEKINEASFAEAFDEEYKNEIVEEKDKKADDNVEKKDEELEEKTEEKNDNIKETDQGDKQSDNGEDTSEDDEEAAAENVNITKSKKVSENERRDLKSFVKSFIDTVEDEKIEIDGHEVNLKQYIKDFPEEALIATALATKIAENIIEERLTNEEKLTQIDLLREKIVAREFWDELHSEISDAKKIVREKEFSEWLNKQPKGMKKLANSWDVEDAKIVLNAYLRDNPKLRQKKESKINALHTETLKSGKTSLPKGNSEDDFEAGFNM